MYNAVVNVIRFAITCSSDYLCRRISQERPSAHFNSTPLPSTHSYPPLPPPHLPPSNSVCGSEEGLRAYPDNMSAAKSTLVHSEVHVYKVVFCWEFFASANCLLLWSRFVAEINFDSNCDLDCRPLVWEMSGKPVQRNVTLFDDYVTIDILEWVET